MRAYRQLSIFLLLCIGLLSGASVDNTAKKRYRIEEGSRLYLKGTSNVNAFTCNCEDRYVESVLEADLSNGYAKFRHAELSMRVKNFNCRNRKIDADMQKALMADQFPFIKVALIDTYQTAKCSAGECNNWFDVQANVQLTIAQVSTREFIRAKAKMLGPNRFQVRGEKAIRMSSYGISPPEAMFGMIKVDDLITFHFDVIVRIEESM